MHSPKSPQWWLRRGTHTRHNWQCTIMGSHWVPHSLHHDRLLPPWMSGPALAPTTTVLSVSTASICREASVLRRRGLEKMILRLHTAHPTPPASVAAMPAHLHAPLPLRRHAKLRMESTTATANSAEWSLPAWGWGSQRSSSVAAPVRSEEARQPILCKASIPRCTRSKSHGGNRRPQKAMAWAQRALTADSSDSHWRARCSTAFIHENMVIPNRSRVTWKRKNQQR
mmetsp:Transcript_56803/g.176162  ORF Transcript_56803/g.176162 Transcript_56803/m.176162 type:complete len:227 (+) Transcript_56803:536-1216(+)